MIYSWCTHTCLIILFISCVIESKPSLHDTIDPNKNILWNATYTDLLKRDLLAHYDKFARPAQHTNLTTVDLDIAVVHIDLDDSKSLLTVNGWIKMVWKDEKLKWNTSDYGGLTKLHVADHEIWEPDIILYNGAIGNNIDHYGNAHAIIYPDGTITWVPPSRYVVYCSLDLSYWPFDRQKCKLKIGAWTYGHDMLQVNINTTKPVETIMLTDFWKVISIVKSSHLKSYECCEEYKLVKTWSVDFDITIERGSSSIKPIILLPAIGIMLLCLSVFWIPGYLTCRLIVCCLLAVIVTVQLLYYTNKTQLVGHKTPIIILYYIFNLFLLCLSVILSIITYNMTNNNHDIILTPMPHTLSNMINSKISTALIFPKYKSMSLNIEDLNEGSTLNDVRENLSYNGIRAVSDEWFRLSMILDQLSFILYLCCYSAFAIKYLF